MAAVSLSPLAEQLLGADDLDLLSGGRTACVKSLSMTKITSHHPLGLKESI